MLWQERLPLSLGRGPTGRVVETSKENLCGQLEALTPGGEGGLFFIEVAININHNDGLFTYAHTHELEPGVRVMVPFRSQTILGIVNKSLPPEQKFNYQIKHIINVIDTSPIITKEQFELIGFCKKYYLNPYGPSLFLAIPKNDKKYVVKIDKNVPIKKELFLTEEQEDIFNIISQNKKGKYLLQGITGSGKTAVYIKLAQGMLEKGRSVLFIVPEIGLTPQLVERVEGYLGIKAAVIHSQITPAQKRDAFFALLQGHKKVLIGARSAIFAPMPNLGLIIVDEEHDGSLRQDDNIRYHGRDLALWRAQNENALIILGSATPSLESIYNTQQQKLVHIRLTKRYIEDRELPKVEVIDLKLRAQDILLKNKDTAKSPGHKICILSEPLVKAMEQAFLGGGQVLLGKDQRGFAQFGLCYSCSQILKCPFCTVSLTFYQKKYLLLCHQCDHQEAPRSICPACSEDNIHYLGLGTERLMEEVRTRFPGKNILRLDRDEVKTLKKLNQTLEDMEQGRADILIGTQMVAKGHNFPKLSLTGIVMADTSLSLPDFRASEKAFALFTQVCGRAGRGDFFGKALIQTFNPEHISIKYAKDHDVDGFVKEELELRRDLGFPPFSRAAMVRVEHKDEVNVQKILEYIKSLIIYNNNINILGPSPCPIMRIDSRFRWQMLIMSKNTKILQENLYKIKNNPDLNSMINKTRARFIIDMDAMSML